MILGGFDIGLIFDDFLNGSQNEKNSEKGGGGVKRAIRPGGSAEDLCSPKSFWSLQSQKNLSEFAKSFRRPVPCEQRAADCNPFGSSSDPISKGPLGGGIGLTRFCLTKVKNGSLELILGKVVC